MRNINDDVRTVLRQKFTEWWQQRGTAVYISIEQNGKVSARNALHGLNKRFWLNVCIVHAGYVCKLIARTDAVFTADNARAFAEYVKQEISNIV